jgi:hypothetical protein
MIIIARRFCTTRPQRASHDKCSSATHLHVYNPASNSKISLVLRRAACERILLYNSGHKQSTTCALNVSKARELGPQPQSAHTPPRKRRYRRRCLRVDGLPFSLALPLPLMKSTTSSTGLDVMSTSSTATSSSPKIVTSSSVTSMNS